MRSSTTAAWLLSVAAAVAQPTEDPGQAFGDPGPVDAVCSTPKVWSNASSSPYCTAATAARTFENAPFEMGEQDYTFPSDDATCEFAGQTAKIAMIYVGKTAGTTLSELVIAAGVPVTPFHSRPSRPTAHSHPAPQPRPAPLTSFHCHTTSRTLHINLTRPHTLTSLAQAAIEGLADNKPAAANWSWGLRDFSQTGDAGACTGACVTPSSPSSSPSTPPTRSPSPSQSWESVRILLVVATVGGIAARVQTCMIECRAALGTLATLATLASLSKCPSFRCSIQQSRCHLGLARTLLAHPVPSTCQRQARSEGVAAGTELRHAPQRRGSDRGRRGGGEVRLVESARDKSTGSLDLL